MKFLTLTRIAALLATSAGLASASIDVCAWGIIMDCDGFASTLLGSLDSLIPLKAFRNVQKFFREKKICDGACLSPKLKAELCEKAYQAKGLVKEKIFLEDIEQCFPDTTAVKESCHVSYECPPGTPAGNICITNSCTLNSSAAAAEGPRAMSVKGDNCYYSYECPAGTPKDMICVVEICDSDKPAPPKCLGFGEYLGPTSTDRSVCEQMCCSGSCHIGYSCPPGAPEGSVCISTDCS